MNKEAERKAAPHLGDVDAGKDGGGLGDARQALGQDLGREVVEVQVDVVLLGAAAAPLPDLQRHAAADHVAAGQVLRRRRVPAGREAQNVSELPLGSTAGLKSLY